jgi:hypothetical protein
MDHDEIFRAWMADLESIRLDIHELFSLRRTFRDLADVFERNTRLQAAGGHMWDWIRLNYAASVLIRLRRQVDRQRNTINLKRLLLDISEHPEVITRARRRAFHRPVESELVEQILDSTFTKLWVRQPDPDGSDNDHVDPEIIRADLAALEDATERVQDVANQSIAHRQRVPPGNVTFKELDQAFDAIESTLQKYYALICGPALVGAEPAPQFDTYEVFTFPWIEPRKR